MDWKKLEQFLYDHKDRGKVSISGGGDPLYKYKVNSRWWEALFEITDKLDIRVDIHTRVKLIDKSFWKDHINRCSFSSDLLEMDAEYLEYLSEFTKIRIVHVVTGATNFGLIDDYLSFQKKIGCQFTIKQLAGCEIGDNDRYNIIKEKYPDVYHLDTGDYNIYYMPNNTIRETFL
jgi:hypothetical protein